MPTLEQAVTYFSTHLDNATWTAADEPTKTALLTAAEVEINSLPLKAMITNELKNKAIFEQAIFRLKYGDKRENVQAHGVKSVSISGGASESYTQLVFGIPLAPRAKLFLTGQFQVGAIV